MDCFATPKDWTTAGLMKWVTREAFGFLKTFLGRFLQWKSIGLSLPTGINFAGKWFSLRYPSRVNMKRYRKWGISVSIPTGLGWTTKRRFLYLKHFPTGVKKKSFGVKYPMVKNIFKGCRL